ncbi:pol-like protein [Colletotrichum musicola]|uniref:Pol-like protein n=1 Tax=Colletotrichum musicola TaxID=2175873 RepID=A0A8H6JZM0_9PEZI|nr:pol-like protein [Colletotrichum musicola]
MPPTFYTAGGDDGTKNPDYFLKYLDRTYCEAKPEAQAIIQLKTLRQRDNERLATFLPRFERTLADAGGYAWPDAVKITMLEGALNRELMDLLITVDLPEDYGHWISRVGGIATKLEQRARANPRVARRRSPAPPVAPRDYDGDVQMSGAVR